MARFNRSKKSGLGSSFLGNLLSSLLIIGVLVSGFAIYNHYDNNKTDEITEKVETEDTGDEVETEVETPSEEVEENEAE